MPLALIGIGIPGSGKTTVLKPFAAAGGYAYISRDDIREEILGDARDQSQNKAIWEEANRRTVMALASGQGVVIDGTFVEEWKRRDLITLLQEAGASQVIGVIADIPFEVAKERNGKRERVVSAEVMEWMRDTLAAQPPTLDEGFDAIVPLERIQAFA